MAAVCRWINYREASAGGTAIVVIRTVLNYFLSKEIERERQEVEAARRAEAVNEP